MGTGENVFQELVFKQVWALTQVTGNQGCPHRKTTWEGTTEPCYCAWCVGESTKNRPKKLRFIAGVARVPRYRNGMVVSETGKSGGQVNSPEVLPALSRLDGPLQDRLGTSAEGMGWRSERPTLPAAHGSCSSGLARMVMSVQINGRLGIGF